jgi:hypothetical protein
MELKNFIKETILQIVEGVLLSQKEITSKHKDVFINPPNPFVSAIVRKNNAPDPRDLCKIEFDVSINSKIIKNEGVDVNLINVISGDISKSRQDGNINKVKFKISVSLPEQII